MGSTLYDLLRTLCAWPAGSRVPFASHPHPAFAALQHAYFEPLVDAAVRFPLVASARPVRWYDARYTALPPDVDELKLTRIQQRYALHYYHVSAELGPVCSEGTAGVCAFMARAWNARKGRECLRVTDADTDTPDDRPPILPCLPETGKKRTREHLEAQERIDDEDSLSLSLSCSTQTLSGSFETGHA